MKKQIASFTLGLVILASATTTSYAADKKPGSNKLTANEKVMKDFNQQFKNVATPVIYSSEDGFIVSSEANGNKITSAYNKKGNWTYTIERFGSGNFVADIVDVVKADYDNFSITGMEKIDQSGYNTVYIVHLENDHCIKTVRVKNDESEVLQDFKKG
ncbi:MAG: hypothetical protein ABIU77_08805 [Ferruginibacter sp.]